MKQEEEKIRKLFQQLREEDERNAPSFSDVWNAALSRQGKSGHRWVVWRLAAVTAVLIALGAGWWMYLRQSTKQQSPVEIVRSDRPVVRSERPVDAFAAPPVSASPTSVNHPPKVTRRQRPFVRPQPPAILISHWRSPTEHLLRVPGEQLFKSVPRLDESLVNIKTILSDQKN